MAVRAGEADASLAGGLIMGAAYTEWRKFALCILTIAGCAAVSMLLADAYPKFGWGAGWLGLWVCNRIEELIKGRP